MAEQRRSRTGSADAWTHYRAASTTDPPDKASMASLPANAEEAKNDGKQYLFNQALLQE